MFPYDEDFYPQSKSLTKVQNTDIWPNSAVCHLFLIYEDFSAYCSGSLVDSFHVLTAGHCVYPVQEGIDSYPEAVVVTCGMNGYDHPFGTALATYAFAPSNWRNNENFDYDWGYLVLDRQKGTTAGMFNLYGTSTLSWYEGQTTALYGYPGAYDEGLGLYKDEAAIAYAEEYILYGYHASLAGMSGGPMLELSNYYQIANHSAHTADKGFSVDVRSRPALISTLGTHFGQHDVPPADFESDWCPGYHWRSYCDYCCQTNDPCGLEDNGKCECEDKCSWDQKDCDSPSDDDDDDDDNDNNTGDDDDSGWEVDCNKIIEDTYYGCNMILENSGHKMPAKDAFLHCLANGLLWSCVEDCYDHEKVYSCSDYSLCITTLCDFNVSTGSDGDDDEESSSCGD